MFVQLQQKIAEMLPSVPRLSFWKELSSLLRVMSQPPALHFTEGLGLHENMRNGSQQGAYGPFGLLVLSVAHDFSVAQPFLQGFSMCGGV